MGKNKSSVAWLFIGIAIVFYGCRSEQQLPTWLLGKWQSKSNQFTIVEDWKKTEGEYSAETVWNDGQKKIKENVRLFLRKEDLVYHVKMSDNDIEFICSDIHSDTLVFTNFQNDFPKYIVYTKPSNNKMDVWIGNSMDDPNKIHYPFKKIQ